MKRSYIQSNIRKGGSITIITGIFFQSLLCSDYSLIEKTNMWLGKSRTGVHPLWNKILSTDLVKQVTEIDIPVYFFHGTYDYTVSYTLAKAYFDKLKAPFKGFYTFKKSAHSPIFEEHEKTGQIIMNDLLKGMNKMADQ